MKIEANDKEVQDILSLGYFKIPRFQRPYSWTGEEVTSFWEDIVRQNHEDYFIGSMVVYQINKPYFGIVDGQQRLTTITLILAALRNFFLDLDDTNLAKGVHNYIEKANIDNINEFILNPESSFPYLQGHIQSFEGEKIDCPVGSEESNLKTAFETITFKIHEILKPLIGDVENRKLLSSDKKDKVISVLKNIRNNALSLKMVFIQVDNEDDAYLIFETLNTRGKDLTSADLVKNLLLKKIKQANATLDRPKVIWDNILQKLDDAGLQNGMGSFLYHFWLSKFNHVTEKNLFIEVKKKVDSVSAANQLLNDLQNNAAYYTKIIKPGLADWKKEEDRLSSSLKALQLFNVKQQAPMVLALIRAYKNSLISLKMASDAIEKIENFHFIFNAISSNRSSGSIATNYSKYAVEFTSSSDHAQIQSTLTSFSRWLQSKVPEYKEFEAGFESLVFTSSKTRNKKIIQYILSKMQGAHSNGLVINYQSMTIEHIFPQSKVDNHVNEKIVGKIGNLILLDPETNNVQLANKKFDEKIAYLKGINYPLDSFLSSSVDWGEQEIVERTAKLSKEAYDKVWKV